jgi:O-antigen/teichoic acid export membrane protein
MRVNIIELETKDYLSLKSLIHQVVVYLPGILLPAFVGIAYISVFTKMLNAFQYGQYSLTLNLALLISVLASQWMKQAINRYLPTIPNQDGRIELKKTIIIGLEAIGFAIVGLGIIGYLFGDLFLPAQWQPFFLAAGFLILILCIYDPLLAVLQADMCAEKYTYYAIANSVLKLVFSLLIILLIIKHSVALLWGTLISTAVLIPFLFRSLQFPYQALLLRKRDLKTVFNRLKQFARYGFPMSVWFITVSLLNTGSLYIIQWFRGATEVGIYSANNNLIQGTMTLLSTPVLLAAHPFLMKSWGVGDKLQTGKWLNIISEWFITTGALLVSFTLLFSKDLASWFLGAEYRQGHIIMPIVIAGSVVWGLGNYTHKPLEFAEKTKTIMLIGIIAAALNLTLNILFVPEFGYIAAAYITVVCYLFYTIAVSILGREIIKLNIKWKQITINIVLTIFSSFMILSLRGFVDQKLGYVLGVLFSLIFWIMVSLGILFINGYLGTIREAVRAKWYGEG